MAFPEDVLDIKVEAGGLTPGFTWTDITQYVYKESIHISRGSADESSRTQPSSCSFLLNNLDGRFSPRNPNGPYYGNFAKNTPLLVSVMGGDRYLDVPGSGRARVLDTAQIDITGDIDIRVDATLYNWTSGTVELIAKYDQTGDQRSWALLASNGHLLYRWTTDGVNIIQLISDDFTPSPDGRLAVRVAHDVDNGASGNDVTFYTAPTIEGPWGRLGDTVTSSGTTSIFNSTAQLAVGDAMEDVGFTSPRGKFWAAQVYDGINGTAAAQVDFRVQTVDDTSFTDDAGLTWDMEGSASINNQINRFRGEVVAWPSRWETGGFDAWVPLRAESLLRRHNQGKGNLRSTLARRIPSDANLVAYWPMEDGENATQFGSLTSGVQPMTFTGEVTPAGHAGPDGSDSLPSFGDNSNWIANVPGAGVSAGAATAEWIMNLQQVTTTERTVMRLGGNGTVITWRFLVDQDTVRVIGYNRSGTEVVNQGIAVDVLGEQINAWTRWKFDIAQNGANVDWGVTFITVGGAGGSFAASYAGTAGRFSSVFGPNPLHSDLSGISFGHVAIFDASLLDTESPFNSADTGFKGEEADDRFDRLVSEEGESGILYGARDRMQSMGAQRPARYVNLLEEIAAADYGIFTDSRDDADASSFVFIGKSSLYNDTPRLTLDYEGDGEVHAPLDPTDDDLYARNAVTATRERGSSVYVEKATGTNSIDEIGLYDTEVTVNIEDDSDLVHIAGWEVHLGTWDEERYPTVLVRLQAAPGLIALASQVNIGSRIRLVNARDEANRTWIPPGDVDLQVRGYRETLSQYEWEIEFQCVPARPWDVAALDRPGQVTDRIDTDGSELTSSVTSVATSFDVTVTDGLDWTTAGEEFPFDILVGGEAMTVTNITYKVQDYFDRTETNGWGTSDSGHTWTTTGGSASDYYVEGV